MYVLSLSANATTASSAPGLGDHSPETLTEGPEGLILNKDEGRVLMMGSAASAKVAPQCGPVARRGFFHRLGFRWQPAEADQVPGRKSRACQSSVSMEGK